MILTRIANHEPVVEMTTLFNFGEEKNHAHDT